VTSSTTSIDPRPAKPCCSILHIDDDADFSQAMRLRLQRHGVSVIRAYDGGEGFLAAMSQPAELVLLDLEMPNGSGQYVLRRLKENPVTRDVPVVVVTSDKSRHTERTLINMGADRVFHKPVEFDRLLNELNYHLPAVRL
jgi:two-component system response regulator MprA